MGEAQPTTILQRDKKFYFEDGDVEFQVDSQLFKIHRFLIERNSPVLKDMLSSENSSDGKLVICSDSTKNFCTLCWMLYATEICAAQKGDIETLMQISFVAHKYGVEEFESWVGEVLSNRLEGVAIDIPLEYLEKFLVDAPHAGQQNLAAKARKAIISRLRHDPYKALGTLKDMLPIAERAKDNELEAGLYYAFLQATVWRTDAASRNVFYGELIPIGKIGTDMDETLLDLPGLTEVQKLRLQYGYCSLVALKYKLERRIPKPQRRRGGNLETWNFTQDDPGAFLEYMHKEVVEWEEENGPPRGKRKPWYSKEEHEKMRIGFEKSLIKRFRCA